LQTANERLSIAGYPVGQGSNDSRIATFFLRLSKPCTGHPGGGKPPIRSHRDQFQISPERIAATIVCQFMGQHRGKLFGREGFHETSRENDDRGVPSLPEKRPTLPDEITISGKCLSCSGLARLFIS
jgi:hypothetical protein